MAEDILGERNPTHADLHAAIVRLSTLVEEREKAEERAHEAVAGAIKEFKDEMRDQLVTQAKTISGLGVRVSALEKTANRGRWTISFVLWAGGAVGALIAAVLGVIQIVKEVGSWLR